MYRKCFLIANNGINKKKYFGYSLHPSSGVLKLAYAVLSPPDDGCKEHPKYVERFCSEIK
jgi:hypothetical protein